MIRPKEIKIEEEKVKRVLEWLSQTSFSLYLHNQWTDFKLHWKAPNEGYPHMYRMYKSDNK